MGQEKARRGIVEKERKTSKEDDKGKDSWGRHDCAKYMKEGNKRNSSDGNVCKKYITGRRKEKEVLRRKHCEKYTKARELERSLRHKI